MNTRFDRFTAAISSIYQDIRRIKLAEMKRYDLQSGHTDCLHLLLHEPEGLTSGELAEHSGMDKAAISRYMNVLEERGFVKSEGAEGTVYRRKWKLTAKGKKAALAIQKRIDTAVSAVGDFLSAEEREQLYQSLECIVANLNAYVEKTAESADRRNGGN